jgi:hypothetical protein
MVVDEEQDRALCARIGSPPSNPKQGVSMTLAAQHDERSPFARLLTHGSGEGILLAIAAAAVLGTSNSPGHANYDALPARGCER